MGSPMTMEFLPNLCSVWPGMLDGSSDLAALGVGDAFSCSEPSGSAGD